MNPHSLRLLDFDIVRGELLDHCWSGDGKKRLLSDGFTHREEELEKIRSLVAGFRRLFTGDMERPSLSMPEIGDAMALAEKPGAALEAPELAAAASYFRQAKTIKTCLSRGGSPLAEEGADLPDLSGTAAKIGKIVGPDGEIRENDIPSLVEIRRRVRSLRRGLDEMARSYLENPAYRGYWQSDTVSQKDGRVVLPLGANFRGRLRGVVHEYSSRGATAFFEPLDIFDGNNRLVEEENEYRREVHRLLRELTAELGERAGEIAFLRERVGHIDAMQARARYSHLHDCFTAAVSRGELSLRGARHPLLGKKAVPIDVEVRDGARILLVTGPNTGGKTVALKTVGLLALMNQFGLDIPAQDGSRLPLFDDIFVDIGDEQSMAESLSTFSAHVKNLSAILAAGGPDSLVLLDELGSGTDPEEGAALAMSFLDRFLDRGLLALVTTHLGALKDYAFTRQGVANASVEFDLGRLQPTYRIVQGLPGASHALDIAERHGAPPGIIAGARAYIDENRTDTGKIIADLVGRKRELDLRERELRERQERAARREEELCARDEELRKKEADLRGDGIREIGSFLSQSRKELENLVRTIKEGSAGREITRDTIREARSFIEKVKERVHQEKELVRRAGAGRRSAVPRSLEPGMEVRIGREGGGRRGILERRLKDGRWLLSSGAVRVTFPEEELFPAAPREERETPDYTVLVSSGGETAKIELDLRGMRAEEALGALRKQMDLALMQGLAEFGIIHGKGEGILQQAVWDYLRASPQVAEYAFARPEAGGTGKTLVILKR